MELTKDQKAGLIFLKDWIKNDKPLATLSGFAGTGKTTLLKYFLNEYTGKVAVTAPTHKAVSVISTVLDKPGKTLHSLHGLRPNVNLASFDIDNVKFDPLGEVSIGLYNLVIIDEASMINIGLLKLNNDRAKMFKVKILFVGDALQLPPIGEQLGAVFTIGNIFSLTSVVRQHDRNPISTILDLVRQDIHNNSTYLAINYILKHPINIINIDGIKSGYALLNRKQFNEKLLDEFPETFANTDVRYISYTNENVIEVNSYIRNNLIDSKDVITVGDIITSNTNTYDEFGAIEIANASDYEIIRAEPFESDYEFAIFKVDLTNRTTGETIFDVNVVNHKDPSFTRYKEVLFELYNRAINSNNSERGLNWRNYYVFKSRYLQLVKLSMGGKVVDRDLSYGYAVTVHKSQGSSYDISFINMKEIVLTQDGNFRKNTKYNPFTIRYTNKLLYVALSRAKHKNILLWL